MAIPFDEKELEVVETLPGIPGFAADFDVLSYPVSQKQNLHDAIINKKPHWVASFRDYENFGPSCIPDVVARGSIWGPEMFEFDNLTQAGGLDMYGIEWVYVPAAMGSMEREDVPRLFDDVNDWKDKVVFPDVDSWPWEECAAHCKPWLEANANKSIAGWIFTGFFERLISFMGFEDAAVALLDEDQEDAIKELMDKIADTMIEVVEHYVKYFGVDYLYIHDDWGTQLAAFFNKDVCRELFVPAMRKVTDRIHDLGCIAELHSCGCHGTVQIENVIAAGWDIWRGQEMNPTPELWEKYGDKICLAPNLDPIPEGATDEEKKAVARAYVEKYCTTPGKPVVLNFESYPVMDKVVAKELYIASREAYNNWPE